jgi:hypothetical protein
MKKAIRDYLFLVALTVAAIFIHGYHFGTEDQAIYLPAIRKILDPSLYSHDSELFLPQTRATFFGNLVAFAVRHTHLSCAAVLFILQVSSIFLILLGCLKLTRRLFHEPSAQWAGTCLVASLLTIPVAGTALYLVDEYMHPSALATFALLFALLVVFPGETPSEPVERTDLRARSLLWMFIWLAVAALVHIQMAFFGALLIAFLLIKMPRRAGSLMTAATFPLRSLWEPTSAAWKKAARTRTEHYLFLWHWYELLGVVAPLAILEAFARLAERQQIPRVAYLSRRLALFGLFGLATGVVLTIPARVERLTPYQPMRTFHILYLLFFLITGALIGKWILRKSVWRWLVLFIPLCCGMFYAQLQLYPGSPHIEWPGVQDPNPWVQAFVWIRHNTPKDAYFALNPRFLKLPGEDFHGFRAFAERSRMADLVKDPAVVTLFPNTGDLWLKQVTALEGWGQFTVKDFERLKRQFGVDWVVLEQPGVPGLDCPYQNSRVRVCRID